MPSMGHLYRRSLAIVFRAKSQNNEKSNTELELFQLGEDTGCSKMLTVRNARSLRKSRELPSGLPI